jgi:carbon dioxide concentrating mechanism protein CcmO
MEAKEKVIAPGPETGRFLEEATRSPSVVGSAIGMVSTQSFPAIVGTADMMLKSAGVTLVGFEKIGSGHCTAIVRGNIADVRVAVDVGAETAERFDQLVSKVVIPRPMPNLEVVLPISSRLAEMVAKQGYSKLSNQAIGLLETRGFPAMVGAADAMLKSAEVQLASYETIGAGLCTAIIRGRVSDVAIAIEAGMHEAERIGELHAVMVIPRPLDDLEVSIPVDQYWLEQPTPLALPLNLKQPQKELVASKEVEQEQQSAEMELPDLQAIPRPTEVEELPEP